MKKIIVGLVISIMLLSTFVSASWLSDMTEWNQKGGLITGNAFGGLFSDAPLAGSEESGDARTSDECKNDCTYQCRNSNGCAGTVFTTEDGGCKFTCSNGDTIETNSKGQSVKEEAGPTQQGLGTRFLGIFSRDKKDLKPLNLNAVNQNRGGIISGRSDPITKDGVFSKERKKIKAIVVNEYLTATDLETKLDLIFFLTTGVASNKVLRLTTIKKELDKPSEHVLRRRTTNGAIQFVNLFKDDFYSPAGRSNDFVPKDGDKCDKSAVGNGGAICRDANDDCWSCDCDAESGECSWDSVGGASSCQTSSGAAIQDECSEGKYGNENSQQLSQVF